MPALASVSLHPGSIHIDGRPQILLTSSLFYFRIPAAEWRDRMRTLRQLGYNAIDVYFPWNYHELAPGKWVFSGQRNVEDFLHAAKEEGLWVVARPGPYICSEWDGGALPAWLFADPNLHVRENSPAYLAAVRTWFDQIMPLLARNQLGRDGTIVLVQLENELDFFDCCDRRGMMAALRDFAWSHGITVPLVACAGQGDISGATGDVEGIVPACNVYFDRRDPQLEVRIRHYAQRLRQRGYPLLITETNRSHAELRRLLIGGAKLLGPYLQAGGADFGFTTSINNWGQPLSFATSYYDFGGMISPGGKVRPEGQEAVILAKIAAALGSALALSTPEAHPPMEIVAAGGSVEGHALALDGGGYLVGLPNVGETSVRVTFGSPKAPFPKRTELEVAANTCPLLLFALPLGRWGLPGGRLAYATAELVESLLLENGLALTFAAAGAAELLLEWPGSTIAEALGWQIEPAPNGWRLWAAGDLPATVEFRGADGRRLRIQSLPHAVVGDLRAAGVEPRQIVAGSASSPQVGSMPLKWRMVAADPCGAAWFAAARACAEGRLHLEQNEIWRGFGWYHAHTAGDKPGLDRVQGLLVTGGADVLSLYLGTRYLGTCVPGGGGAFVPVPPEAGDAQEVVVRAEIWGHSNFDDHRLPALRLQSLRGLGGLVAVRSVRNLTPNWYYQHGSQAPSGPADPTWPLLYFGGWSSTDEPARGVYFQQLARASGMTACILHFAGLEASAQVFVGGMRIGSVNPLNPYVDLSGLLQPGEEAELAVAVEQDYRRPAGQIMLYEGEFLHDWRLAAWDEAELAAMAQAAQASATIVDVPLQLASGAMAWLHAELPQAHDWESGYCLQFAGRGIKATVLIGARVVGRIWLPSELRPRMAGGADDRVLLPAAWLRESDGVVHILLESVSSTSELQGIKVTPDG